MKVIFSVLLTCLTTAGLFSQFSAPHDKWSALLKKYVSPYGKVNYKGLKADEALLDEYLEILASHVPGPAWKVEDQKAYWINAYNAFTIKLVLKHYPLKSIMDIKERDNDAWHIPFIKLGGKYYTLDYIEKTMLLGQFNDSRIHFAINCSAMSCPPLKNIAYSAENIEIELRLAGRQFVNDTRYNHLNENHLQLSQIFNWYKSDFLREEATLQIYIEKNTPHLKVSEKASISFVDYDWSLNE